MKLLSGVGRSHGNFPAKIAAKLRLGSRAERRILPPKIRWFTEMGLTMYLSIVSSPRTHAMPTSGVTTKSVQPVLLVGGLGYLGLFRQNKYVPQSGT